jgi:hypothetical protein
MPRHVIPMITTMIFLASPLIALTCLIPLDSMGAPMSCLKGQSMWWQVLNPSGVGVGLWAQISLKDSYDGASGSTTRDDQQSLSECGDI